MVKILKQGFGFGVVGGIQIALEWLIFVAFTAAGAPASGANVAGRATAATLGFWINGKWTFAKVDGVRLGVTHLGRYLASWVILTALSTLIVLIITHTEGLHMAWKMKPVVDLFLAAISFAVSKYWIYR